MNINSINSKTAFLAINAKAEQNGEKPKPAADAGVKAETGPKDVISVSADARQNDDAVSAAVDYAKKLAGARDHYHNAPVKPLPSAVIAATAAADVAVPASDDAIALHPHAGVKPVRHDWFKHHDDAWGEKVKQRPQWTKHPIATSNG